MFVKIKDEGSGISEEDLKFIWDRFYTVDKARSGNKTGTGLGLSIVEKIAILHNCEVIFDVKNDVFSVIISYSK